MALNIAIIGGGPAGLMLACLLHLSPIAIRVAIFESDAGPTSRSQGSTLDLHPDSGLAAIKKAQLWTEFKQHARYDGEALRFIDKDFTIWFENENPGGDEARSNGRPEIDRVKLRDILLNSVPQEIIKWGRRLQSVELMPGDADCFGLVFKDGTREDGFDLVVGADGAWSHVRSSYLSDEQPFSTGIHGLITSIPMAATTDPDTYKLVNRGSVFSYSDGKGINAQYIGDGSINVTAWFTQQHGFITQPSQPKTAAALQPYIQTHYGDWSPNLTRLFAHVDDGIWQTELYMLPVDWRWQHKRGVTLIGDAAHLMTPFAGEGVNLALSDAADLADAIISTVSAHPFKCSTATSVHDALDAAISTAEETIYKRSRAIRKTTYENMHDQFFSQTPMSSFLPRVAARTLLINDPWFAGGSELLARVLMRGALWGGLLWRWLKGWISQ
ncbi:MAG: hypothetical protein GOMPHAMPRED_007060 [Gomphillus americanus]|uniref:FAD-binding domain-containing protein n=1 Tax=Gomphillus americanus TaxID=1940652 RepID=A0A8H3ERL5_9LECA|nr:MAG: hypothetical protein GOMPHAMPRED_007060 [Gomphillus americanus]